MQLKKNIRGVVRALKSLKIRFAGLSHCTVVPKQDTAKCPIFIVCALVVVN
jgi:hypothetical protein